MACLACTFLQKGVSKQLSILLIAQRRTMCAVFFEKNRKGDDKERRVPYMKNLKNQVQNFGPNLRLWTKEQKEKFTSSPMLYNDHGNYEVVYRFNDRASVESWLVSTDKDTQRGRSTANFTFSKNRTGVFHGNLCKEPTKDGKTKYAGFANIAAPKPLKSFYRPTVMDWSVFNCLLLRVRGDGRSYMLVIGCDFYFDVNWLNRWSFPLYTRGGPYWQNVKIPFAKFYNAHSGRIQDRQELVPLHIVNSFGITAGDSGEGPFHLEIDSIGLLYDVNLSGKHAYEMYDNKYWEVQC